MGFNRILYYAFTKIKNRRNWEKLKKLLNWWGGLFDNRALCFLLCVPSSMPKLFLLRVACAVSPRAALIPSGQTSLSSRSLQESELRIQCHLWKERFTTLYFPFYWLVEPHMINSTLLNCNNLKDAFVDIWKLLSLRKFMTTVVILKARELTPNQYYFELDLLSVIPYPSHYVQWQAIVNTAMNFHFR